MAISEPDWHMHRHEGLSVMREHLSLGLSTQRSHKKASQQNYKPEKISVLLHWEQNGFCFLQDNELTRAHHTERGNPCGHKCYHW